MPSRVGVTLESALTSAHIVIQVRLPNRPGALGAVASRIGAIGANITDIEVAVTTETGVQAEADSAIDEFHLDLPDAGDLEVIEVLRGELREVDGARLESWRHGGGCCSR